MQHKTLDGNEAAAAVAHRLSEVVVIYPITPASLMGELADAWSADGRANLWGAVPDVVQMQSEAGAAGTLHGALQAGALATTFTASQGLLLMIPNLYKIAGELTACCIHVAARTVATHALSIFGDHSDVMACRQTGFALLASASVQEAQDMACIGTAASLLSRVPLLHFFDGFRTSHEINKIAPLPDDDLRAMIDLQAVEAHRLRGLTPDRPVLRGTAQNPDTFFQAREACNPFYDACPDIVQQTMDRFAERTGRAYHLFDYAGHPQAERVLVLMGSGAETAETTVRQLAAAGERVGVVTVRLYRPFSVAAFAAALPPTVRRIAVLDRTKEPGAVGEPLYQDVVAALAETFPPGAAPRVVGGRYGLSSKEFDPAMVKAVVDELTREEPRNHFTVGITDDVTGRSLAVDGEFSIEPDDEVRAVFYGLGSDGTVGANKQSIKIIGEQTDQGAQGYFVYDSKKAGAMTISHLRFGPRPIRAPYLIRQARFVACHVWEFLDRIDVLEVAAPRAVVLLDAPFPPEEVWDRLPREAQAQIVERGLELYAIDAGRVAREAGLGGRINTVMQTCFFAISGVLQRDEAIAQIKQSIEQSYAKKGREVVERNFQAVDQTLAHLHRIETPAEVTSERRRPPLVAAGAPDFVQRVTAVMMAGQGDRLPVSAFPPDGTWPVGTARWEKRNLAQQIPVWDTELCIQCNKCVLVCPHTAILARVYPAERAAGAPPSFKSTAWRGPGFAGQRYTLQTAPEDCTGCTLCVQVCPAKDKADPQRKAIGMQDQAPLREAEAANLAFFEGLPAPDRSSLKLSDVKQSQLMPSLFGASGACPGCGETPYLKLLTQLFGDRLMVANATGCSSIFGGNLPTTPWSAGADGRGPAWSNSLFEDNAEFGLGFRLAVDVHRDRARALLAALAERLDPPLVEALLDGAPDSAVAALRDATAGIDDPRARELERLAGHLTPKSVWLVGGDGWAYDIGYGGLDHVLAGDRDVNVLVLDTEVYSNTGGQQSKATPLGAAAKFAVAGKSTGKKDLGLEAMSYGHVYVARVAFGAKDAQTLRALREAESYPGPSLVIAYAHCIAHGYELSHGLEQQRLAVESGVWPLYRFDPRRIALGKPPLQLDSGPPKIPVERFMQGEARFRMVEKRDRERYRMLQQAAQLEAARRYAVYRQLGGVVVPLDGNDS